MISFKHLELNLTVNDYSWNAFRPMQNHTLAKNLRKIVPIPAVSVKRPEIILPLALFLSQAPFIFCIPFAMNAFVICQVE